MKVPVSRSFWLTLLCAVMLFGLYWIPSVEIGETHTRKVDILSDLRPDEPEMEEDSVVSPIIAEVPMVFEDTCKSGITCIEDFSDSTNRGMEPFYEALSMHDTLPRPVRIAYFGDSYIEGDILTADLRALLQERFGGCGVGYVDMASNSYGFRQSVKHQFSGWDFHSITDSTGFDHSLQGISNRYFKPYNDAYAEYRGVENKYPLLDTCRMATIYLKANDSLELRSTVNGGNERMYLVKPNQHLQTFTRMGDIGKVRWTVKQTGESTFFGVSLDDTCGISLDNFSMRGSSGLSLRSIPQATLRDFNRLRAYDLIVLQYGLNVATPRGVNYDKYYKGMCDVIEMLKEAFPQAGILVVSVGDRAYKRDDGEFRTMLGVRNLIKYQQQLAVEKGVAFWNMYSAMGGEGSIQQLASQGLANLDYTHINFKGGEHLANLLYEAVMYGYEQHNKKKQYAQP